MLYRTQKSLYPFPGFFCIRLTVRYVPIPQQCSPFTLNRDWFEHEQSERGRVFYSQSFIDAENNALRSPLSILHRQ